MDDNEGLGILPDEPITESEAKESVPVEDENPFKDIEEPEFAPETQILVLKTQVGQERRVIEMLGNKARRFGIPIISLLSPQELRGYIFIETTDVLGVQKGIRGVSYARSLVSQDVEIRDEEGNFVKDRRGKIITERMPVDTPFNDIAHFLTPVSAVAKIGVADIVELVSGPFRGEKAKVTKVDDAREELTVELIDSMVPIPITVKGEHVRVLEKAAE
ncbi:MAG: transcription elongation factor Spt5 [Thermoplasmatota archaeon]